jgi:purine-binding chemotaxis protein CheW
MAVETYFESGSTQTVEPKGEKGMETTLKKVEGKYLTFRLGREEYGIEILKVREIVGLMDITSVPLTALYIRGVINLRGKIIPVVDMRKKFGLPETEASRETCIITVMVQGKEVEVLTGLLVDAVREVVQVAASEVEPVPALGEDMKLDFVTGLSKSKGRVVVLLDMDKVMQAQDLQEFKKLEQLADDVLAAEKKEA